MKRNRFGINVDEGVALTSLEEFDRLFVDTESEAEKSLLEWLRTGEGPVLFGGQIGCGKTTLLEYLFHKSQIKPDIVFHFDRASLNLSSTDSWSIVFAELFRYIAVQDLMGMDEIPSEYSEMLGDTPERWLESISQIRLDTFSTESVEKSRAFHCMLESNQEYLPQFFASLVRGISFCKKRPMFLFASGIDKFEPGSSAYFALTDILQTLSVHKTLFELNAVHLFYGDPWMGKMGKIIIKALGHRQIEEMLVKRLGRYAKTYTDDVALIAGYSGGIPRQALRLLDSFLAAQKRLPNKREAFSQSVEQVNRDLFAFSPRPESALMKNVDKNRFLETGLIALPGDQETAKRAIFGNWVVLEEHMHESRWKAVVNPIIKESFVDVAPEEPERALLKAYARQAGMSEVGLEVDIHQDGWHHTLMDQLESPIELNVTEILDSISSALLSIQRADRVIIAFENKTVVNAVRAYLEAKSNTYEYQVWSHHVIKASPLFEMIEHLSERNVDVYSFEFAGEFPKDSLDELNLRRDSFLDRQLIWWIPKEKLNAYLGRWTQLRQLFQVYVLEEDLAKSLSVDEIESDLEFMDELAELEGTASFSYVENLKIVLDYLKGVKHG
jgi:hypothetical protein